MDITTLATVNEDNGVFAHFPDVTGKPLFTGENEDKKPVGALVAGTYSARYKKAQKTLRDEQTLAMRRGVQLDGDALEAAQYRLEAACIIEWTLVARGAPFPITAENWKAVADKQPQWREKLQQTMTDHERFFATS